MAAKYHKQVDGEWVRPLQKGFRLRCCDCGLVHRIDFRLRGSQIEFRARRMKRATSDARKRMVMDSEQVKHVAFVNRRKYQARRWGMEAIEQVRGALGALDDRVFEARQSYAVLYTCRAAHYAADMLDAGNHGSSSTATEPKASTGEQGEATSRQESSATP